MMASDLWSPKASDALSAPPTSADGRPIVVNYRIILFSIHDIKTREQCAGIHMALVFYWTDARMAGWHGPTLPPMLWGPDAWICGAVEPPNIDDEQFVLIDATEGRLKRIVHFRANLRMRMPNLSRFPFDLQELDAGFESISHWRVLSGWPRGSLPAGQSYILEPVELPTEGVLFTQKWDGSITGWTFRSYRTAQEQETNKDAGFTKTEIHLKLSMYRKHRYYAFKVLFPLYLLTGTAFAVQFIPISEIQDRIACTFTMFLAAFSLIYVISEELPRVDNITLIDRNIAMTLFTLSWLTCESMIVYQIHQAELETLESEDKSEHSRWSLARLVDVILGGVALVAYTLVAHRTYQGGRRVLMQEIQKCDEQAKIADAVQSVKVRTADEYEESQRAEKTEKSVFHRIPRDAFNLGIGGKMTRFSRADCERSKDVASSAQVMTDKL